LNKATKHAYIWNKKEVYHTEQKVKEGIKKKKGKRKNI
jgi:hypothetical protein